MYNKTIHKLAHVTESSCQCDSFPTWNPREHCSAWILTSRFNLLLAEQAYHCCLQTLRKTFFLKIKMLEIIYFDILLQLQEQPQSQYQQHSELIIAAFISLQTHWQNVLYTRVEKELVENLFRKKYYFTVRAKMLSSLLCCLCKHK